MFSSNLKRSVATLGVVAGLLAAAVPASATPVGVQPGQENDALTVKAPTNAGTQVGSEGVKAPSTEQSWAWHEAARTGVASAEVFELNTLGGDDTVDARGTQVGSEGVKGNDGAPGREPLSGYSFGASQTGTSNYSWGASQTGTMDIMKNYDMASPY